MNRRAQNNGIDDHSRYRDSHPSLSGIPKSSQVTSKQNNRMQGIA